MLIFAQLYGGFLKESLKAIEKEQIINNNK